MLKLKTILLLIASIIATSILTGCIPANDHVGKPAAHSYKDNYYNRSDYYNRNNYYYR